MIGDKGLTHFSEVKEDGEKRGVCIWEAKMVSSKANDH